METGCARERVGGDSLYLSYYSTVVSTQKILLEIRPLSSQATAPSSLSVGVGGKLTMAAANGSSSRAAQDPPARRSARDRAAKTGDLASSFTKYVDSAPPQEVKDLTDQLQRALGAIANDAEAEGGAAEGDAGTDNANLEGAAAQPGRRRARRRSNSAASLTSATSPTSASLTRPAGDEYYAPKSSSRRNSRAGSELAASMKLAAQKALAELGELKDDGEDDDELVLTGVLEGVREESVRRLLREDSKLEA